MKNKDAFLDEVVEYVKFQFDRNDIRDELAAHIEDRQEYFEQKGIESGEAEARAVEAMGDAREIGEALNREHKAWLGRLWIISKVMLIALIVYFLVAPYGIRDVADDLKNAFKSTDTVIEDRMETVSNAFADDGVNIERVEIDRDFTVNEVELNFKSAIYISGENMDDDYLFLYISQNNGSIFHPYGRDSSDYYYSNMNASYLECDKRTATIIIPDDTEYFGGLPGKDRTYIGSPKLLTERSPKTGIELECHLPKRIKNIRVVYDRYGEYFEFEIPLEDVTGGERNA